MNDALWQFEFQDYAATVTLKAMLGLNGNAANLSEFDLIAGLPNQLTRLRAYLLTLDLHEQGCARGLRGDCGWGQ